MPDSCDHGAELCNWADGCVERLVLDAKLCPVESMMEHVARYLFATQFVIGNRVLDAACGTGYGSSILCAASAKHVTGVDVTPSAVAWAQERYGRTSLEFIVQDAHTIDALNRQFDVIVSFETIEHVRDPGMFLGAVAHCLAPGGLFLVSTPYRLPEQTQNGHPKNPHHHVEWTFAEFEGLLTPLFKDIQWYTQGLRVRRGHYPLSRTYRANRVRRWYKDARTAKPVGIGDLLVRRFPTSLERIVEARYLIAVCRGVRDGGH